MKKKYRLETQLIHAGVGESRPAGAVSFPIFQSSTYENRGGEDYHSLTYIRLNNTPNHQLLHARLAALEGAEAALVTSSGMAAISTTLLALLRQGDHLLAQDCLYGGTHDFLTQDFPPLGLSFDLIPGRDPSQWESRLRPNTRLIYVETMTNPLLQVIDLEEVVRFARRHGLISVIDNTFASPLNFRPAQWGFDLSLHSCTKYLNGHSDIVAGAVIGRAELVNRIRRKLGHLGGSLDPHACFLLERGMKTLAVRVRHQNQSAQRIAEFLAQHPAVAEVHYPGLPDHPDHALARRYLEGFSGMLSFRLRGGVEAAERFLRELRIPILAPSLGGVESLITRPALTSHAGMKAEERRRLGISDDLIRLSVGLENTQDLLEDLEQALERVTASRVASAPPWGEGN